MIRKRMWNEKIGKSNEKWKVWNQHKKNVGKVLRERANDPNRVKVEQVFKNCVI